MIMRRLLSYDPLTRIGSGHPRYAQITKYGCPTSEDHGATGTAHNKPSDEDLWLVKRSGIEGRWYPVGRLLVKSDGSWTVPALSPALGQQELYVILVPITEDAQFIDYVNNLANSDLGISSLPPASMVEAVSSINVKK
jgi:hypothetical protein